MQVDVITLPPPIAGGGLAENILAGLFWSDGRGPHRIGGRAGEGDRRSEDTDHRRERDRQSQSPAVDAAVPMRAADVTAQAEREMASDSRAFIRRETRTAQREQFAEQRAAFGKALADAAGRHSPDAPVHEKPQPQRSTATGSGASAQNDSGASARASSPGPDARPAVDVAASNVSKSAATARAPGPESPAPIPGLGGAAMGVRSPWTTPADTTGSTTGISRGANDSKVRAIAAARDAATTMTAAKPPARAISPIAVRTNSSPDLVVPTGRGTAARGGAASSAGAIEGPESPRSFDANLDRILRFARAQLGVDRSTATIQLDPPELGSVRLHLDLRSESLSLLIETEAAAAQRLLSQQLDTLRQSLDAAGVQLERVEVRPLALPTERSDADGSPSDAQRSPHDGAAHRDADPGGGTEGGMEAPGAASTSPIDPPVIPTSVTESRVNILA